MYITNNETSSAESLKFFIVFGFYFYSKKYGLSFSKLECVNTFSTSAAVRASDTVVQFSSRPWSLLSRLSWLLTITFCRILSSFGCYQFVISSSRHVIINNKIVLKFFISYCRQNWACLKQLKMVSDLSLFQAL